MTFTSTELKSILVTISSLAVEVGARAATQFNTSVDTCQKTSPHDLVTKFDKEGEEYIYKKLLAHYPDYGFLGEEGGYRNFKEGTPFWVVDPIDGTLNFARGMPAFSVSIALVHHKKSYLGVCYIPISKELFSAADGLGATLNGRPIQASSTKDFDHCILAVPPNQLRNKTPKAAIRRSGSSVIDICYVAKGATDGFYDSLLNPWDFAASSLVAKEAGAEIFSLKSESLDMNKKSDILVSNKYISDTFTKWISTEKG
ncbi:MAG: 3'(2'),5'-bisphosphate nucleotidase CysQ [Chlamydiia bacterium]|nr:3'(2'),5'-bisphosphate nucleotidase CysQ [Chlamydiia bacterium]MCH9618160.1 3'(2'),5'-bisphosphate nucleotidase CysQ [Chlamydiia bacterium]MCH9624470.1 3'(2'),5'-bisphosphate nucleotidase CysQ [Chlamydiia bacterium]